MSFFTTGDGYSLRHLTDGFDWDTLGSAATVVDLGGSHGDAAFALARKYPGFHLIVQELPQGCREFKRRGGPRCQIHGSRHLRRAARSWR